MMMISIISFFVQEVFNLMVLIQAEVLSLFKPAQWLGFLNKNRAHVLWTIRLASEASTTANTLHEVMNALKHLEEVTPQHTTKSFHVIKAGNLINKRRWNEVQGIFHSWYITKLGKWVDDIHISVLPTAGRSTVIAEAWSYSTSIVPASLPFAPFLSLLLWWIPFDDHYQNYAHLREIRHHLNSKGFEVEENILKHGSCIYTFDSKMGKGIAKSQ